eukprot:738275-Prorocentrum_minimum.AAC.1
MDEYYGRAGPQVPAAQRGAWTAAHPPARVRRGLGGGREGVQTRRSRPQLPSAVLGPQPTRLPGQNILLLLHTGK